MSTARSEQIVVVEADWPAPKSIKALVTTRQGGVATGRYAASNIASHCGDQLETVLQNRALLREQQALPAEPLWLEQVHGTDVAKLATRAVTPPVADACAGASGDGVIAIQTADCLPVLFCSRGGQRIAGAHAGWRSLVNGVLEKTVGTMNVPADEILAWLGPAIGPQAFKVGAEVREEFLAKGPVPEAAFKPIVDSDKWLADIYSLARARLEAVGVTAIYGGGLCTFNDADRFYSYRRDGVTGRMVSLIWSTGLEM